MERYENNPWRGFLTQPRIFCVIGNFVLWHKKRSAGCALARKRNMSQATALGARMCQSTFFFARIIIFYKLFWKSMVSYWWFQEGETHLPLRIICYYSPPEEVGVFSTEINIKIDVRVKSFWPLWYRIALHCVLPHLRAASVGAKHVSLAHSTLKNLV